ncbi:zinc finger protein 644a [Trichomycterus rosablanca]|uniref:zinc finger protein 644a n=1 Tax=Trichomycterus rosablanca TaxID=2290929 RepID=UPI002F35F280
MSVLEKSIKTEEYAKPISGISDHLLNTPVFSSGGSVLELSMQCPYENMTPNGDHSDLLTHVSFIDSIYAEGPAKAAYVNGSSSPHISDEVLLDISKNVPGFLPESAQAQNSPSTTSVQLEECDPLQKDHEATARQMFTAGDVENQGMWGFATDSPENSPEDSCDDGEHLDWNPHKEFLDFLMEDTEEITATSNCRKRKRKMDMVVMVDPSEDDGDHVKLDSKHYHQDEGSQGAQKSKYSNGTKVTFEHFSPKPVKSRKTSQNHTFVRGCISIESGSNVESTLLPSNKSYEKKSDSQTHMKKNTKEKPFICRECERSFYDRDSLLEHVAVHQKKKKKNLPDVKEPNKTKDKGKNRRLHCPQCSFGTNCPNDFVQHAKTHEKEKRYHPCPKCNHTALNEVDLVGHLIRKHPVTQEKPLKKCKQDGLQSGKRKVGAAGRSAPTLCRSKKKKNNKVVKNHTKVPHRPVLNKEEEKSSHGSESSKNCLPSAKPSKPKKTQPSEGCRLLEIDRTKWKDSVSNKLPKSKSVPDKSIKTPSHKKKTNPDPNLDHTCVTQNSPDVGKSTTKMSRNLEAKLPLNKASIPPSKSKGEQLALKKVTSVSVDPDLFSTYDGASEGEKTSTEYQSVRPTKSKPLKKSPSKRKASTPFHNLQGQDILIDFPKCRQMFEQNSSLYLLNKHDPDGINGQFCSDSSPPAKGSPRAFCDPSERDFPPALPQMFSIKEECTETEVWPDTTESGSVLMNGGVTVNLKRCPYCPALFESGIGLSNHVRGHLHRVGVSYDARHVVSTAEVACHDKGPHRRRVHAVPRIQKDVDFPDAVQSPSDPPPEQKYNLVCPLCRERFESRTGLSNHVRGHLKRLGKPCSTTTTKSPVLVLKTLMRNKQYHSKLQALKNKKRSRSRNAFNPFRLKNGLIASAAKVQRLVQADHVSSQENNGTESNEDESKGSPSSDLIGILKKRRAHEEARARTQPQTARKALLAPPVKEGAPPEPLPNSVSEKGKLNRRVCVHCNATFYSGVALSNHLRAYLRRKQNALLEGTTYDCKKKQRSRSGSKKKTHLLSQTPEDLYRLTCRFCDLVFQGPLSVQEDWVKHLQRHIMNTAVPHTGAAMVEVTGLTGLTGLPDEPNTHAQPQTSV